MHSIGRSNIYMSIVSEHKKSTSVKGHHIFNTVIDQLLQDWQDRCLLRLHFFVKPLPQFVQLNGFSPVWLRRCISRVHFWMKPFPQSRQRYGFSPVCVRWWVYRCPFWVYRLPQSVHLKGFSPVWLLWCTSSWLKHLNLFEQYVQTKRLSTEKVSLCALMDFVTVKLCGRPNEERSVSDPHVLDDNRNTWFIVIFPGEMLLFDCSEIEFAVSCFWLPLSTSGTSSTASLMGDRFTSGVPVIEWKWC